MNSKKKIIDTLHSADKASVERLMAEETKKREIFAKIQQRANIERSEYTDNVSGVENYGRRISMTKIASIAASAILIVGSISGGTAFIMNNKKPVDTVPEPAQSSTETTTETATETTTIAEVTTGSKTTSVTETTTNAQTTKETETTSLTETETTTDKTTASAEDTQELSITKEELVERVNNSENYFDKLSAEYSFTLMHREFLPKPENTVGKVYIDNTTLTAVEEKYSYYDDKFVSSHLCAIKDKYELWALESLATEIDFENCGYKFLDAPDKKYGIYPNDDPSDRVCVQLNLNSFCPVYDNWEITGERTENGRNIVSISGYYEAYANYNFTAEIDAATGITLSFESYDAYDGTPDTIFKVTDYKYDDEAVEFTTAADILSKIKNGGYEKGTNDYNDIDIEDLNW